jgi:hypothetical protein
MRSLPLASTPSLRRSLVAGVPFASQEVPG